MLTLSWTSPSSLERSYGTLVSLECVWNTIQTLSWTIPQPHLWYPGVAQLHVKHNTKHWVETIPQPHLWYPEVAQIQVKHTANIELDNPSASLMVPWCRSIACKTQYEHWVETIPRPHLCYSLQSRLQRQLSEPRYRAVQYCKGMAHPMPHNRLPGRRTGKCSPGWIGMDHHALSVGAINHDQTKTLALHCRCVIFTKTAKSSNGRGWFFTQVTRQMTGRGGYPQNKYQYSLVFLIGSLTT